MLLGSALLHAQERTLAVTATDAAARPTQRVALVIGNSAYATAPLRNPVNDARAMARTLRELGFEVIARENASLKQMLDAVREFGRRSERAQAGLFYFAGHGIQIKGRNYLVPVDASFEHEDEVPYRSLDAGLVLDKMDAAKTRVNLMVLDACRNNPFHRSFRSRAQGLAEMEAPAGSLIAFATAPGSVALDGTGTHGVYTKHLLRQIAEPGLAVEQTFKNVRIGVVEETGERQIPWESSSLRDDFQFRPRAAAAVAGPVAAAPGVNAETAIELAFWDTVKDSGRADDYAAYLEQFPAGRFVALARIRQRELTKPATAPAPAIQTSRPPVMARPQAAPAAVSAPVAGAGQKTGAYVDLPGNVHAAVAFSHDNRLVALAGNDGRLRLFFVSNGGASMTMTFAPATPLSAVSFSPDGKHLAIASESGETRLIEIASRRQIWHRQPHATRITGLAFSPDGRYLMAGSRDGVLDLAAVKDGLTVRRLEVGGLQLLGLNFSPDGRYVAAAQGEERSHVVKVLDVGNGRQRLAIAAAAASFSVNGRYLLAASGGHTPTLFDLASGEELRRFERYPLSIFAGAYAESGQFVATVDAEGRGQLLETGEGRVVSHTDGRGARPVAAAFSNDLRRFVVIDAYGRAALYRFEVKS